MVETPYYSGKSTIIEWS